MKAQILQDLSGPRVLDDDADGAPDGRRLRRDRNRAAVVDALLELYGEGHLDPSAAEVAERAGLSPRSLFRYFADVDDLCRAAVARQSGRVGPLAVLQVGPDDPLPVRIEALVASRSRLFETIGSVGLVARMRSHFQHVIAEELTTSRRQLREQVADLFAPELTTLAPADRRAVLASLDVLCSYESHHLLRHDQGLTAAAARAALEAGVTRLLRPTP